MMTVKLLPQKNVIRSSHASRENLFKLRATNYELRVRAGKKNRASPRLGLARFVGFPDGSTPAAEGRPS